MCESLDPLQRLRRKLATLERAPPRRGERTCTGHAEIDAALGEGLERGKLHEVFATHSADASSATGFAAMLGQRLGGGIVWLREDAAERQGGALHAAGLIEIGIDPARLIVGVLPDALAVLRAAADVVRCPVGVAVVELWGNPSLMDLTASRRLALAAEASGVTVLMTRIAALPTPSAAQTRWRVGSAASAPLEADAPGHPALVIELLRQRGRAETGNWRVEWDREQAIFRATDTRPAALSGAVAALPGDGSADAGGGVALRLAG